MRHHTIWSKIRCWQFSLWRVKTVKIHESSLWLWVDMWDPHSVHVHHPSPMSCVNVNDWPVNDIQLNDIFCATWLRLRCNWSNMLLDSGSWLVAVAVMIFPCFWGWKCHPTSSWMPRLHAASGGSIEAPLSCQDFWDVWTSNPGNRALHCEWFNFYWMSFKWFFTMPVYWRCGWSLQGPLALFFWQPLFGHKHLYLWRDCAQSSKRAAQDLIPFHNDWQCSRNTPHHHHLF